MRDPLHDLEAGLKALDVSVQDAEGSAKTRAALTEAVRAVRADIKAVREAEDKLGRAYPWAPDRVKLMEPLLAALDENMDRVKLPKTH